MLCFGSIWLISHEIDSAYWQEWKLFSKKEGMSIPGFVLVHIPMIFLILMGVDLGKGTKLGGVNHFDYSWDIGYFCFFLPQLSSTQGTTGV